MAITRAELAAWIGSELAELLEAGALTAGDGSTTGSVVNAITKALREMGLATVDELGDGDAAEVYDLVELYALERIVNALATRVDFSADGASFKMMQAHDAAVARYERQRAKCATAYGVGGATPAVVARVATLGALTDEAVEYSG